MTCDPNTISRLTSCLRCLTDYQLRVARTYLLCQWALRVSATGTPSAPSAPDIHVGSDENTVVVLWTNGATMGTTNEIWKSTDGTTFNLFATVGGAISDHVDATGMAAGDIWYYKVRACNGAICSAFTSVVSASFNYTSPNVAAISFPTLVRAFGFFMADTLAALTSVSLPALKSVLGNLQIANNPNLTTITLTVLSTVGSSIFLGANKITGAFSLPALTSTGNDLQIHTNSLITSFTANALTSIGGNFTSQSCTGCTSISMSTLNGTGGNLDFNTCTSLITITLTNFQNVSGTFNFNGCSSLVNFSMPALQGIQDMTFTGCTVLQTVTLNSLINVAGNITGNGNAALTTFSIPNAGFGTDGNTINLSGCALLAATVNQVLARGVASGVVAYTFTLNAGTNAAPSGQGVVDKATLIGLGNTVTTN